MRSSCGGRCGTQSIIPGSSKENIERRHLRIGAAFTATVMARVVVLAVAGCGNKAASTSSSPAASQSGAAGGTVRAYLGQAQSILSHVRTTAGALPDATASLSRTPDDTWTASTARLNEIASQLGIEASSLAALTPPSALMPVQDAVVKGLHAIQAKVNDLSGLLYGQSATEATANSSIQSQVDSMKAKLLALSAKLAGPIGGTPSASPTPSGLRVRTCRRPSNDGGRAQAERL